MKNELGRSITEMLMTLAIIGILSTLGVWGISRAFTVHNANALIEDVRLAGFIVADEMLETLPENQDEISMENRFMKTTPYIFSAFKEEGIYEKESTSFAIVADDVPYNICMEVKQRKVDWLEEILPNGKENTCYNDKQNSVSFFFNTQLNTEKTINRECKTNADCETQTPYCCAGICQMQAECECPNDGKWRKVINYAANGSEEILGQTCCMQGYDTAV
ncbi:MAG: Tfp pilus assembly protein FimT/FimU, partial [Alphaproteobacteria bacterium]